MNEDQFARLSSSFEQLTADGLKVEGGSLPSGEKLDERTQELFNRLTKMSENEKLETDNEKKEEKEKSTENNNENAIANLNSKNSNEQNKNEGKKEKDKKPKLENNKKETDKKSKKINETPEVAPVLEGEFKP